MCATRCPQAVLAGTGPDHAWTTYHRLASTQLYSDFVPRLYTDAEYLFSSTQATSSDSVVLVVVRDQALEGVAHGLRGLQHRRSSCWVVHTQPRHARKDAEHHAGPLHHLLLPIHRLRDEGLAVRAPVQPAVLPRGELRIKRANPTTPTLARTASNLDSIDGRDANESSSL